MIGKIGKQMQGLCKAIVSCLQHVVTISKNALHGVKNPMGWQSKPWNKKSAFVLSGLLLAYIGFGCALNALYPFPLFYVFLVLFSVILIITFLAEKRYSYVLLEIRGLTIPNAGFDDANYIYSKLEKSLTFLLVPVCIVLIFGILGVAVFGGVTFSATLIWCLAFFALVVYISIIGYVEYIALFRYITTIASTRVTISNQIKATTHTIPTEVDWLQKLTKLSHLYRTVFFSIGTLYIASFGLFCYHPAFETDNKHFFTYVLWAIIFVAIVVVFPIVSILEYNRIKRIVKKVKESYIGELIEEYDASLKRSPQWIKKHASMMTSMFAVTIENTKDYPIPNRLSASYAFVVAVINLLGSIVTINDLSNIVISLR